MQYYVGVDDDRHMVDHPPLFACECEGRKTLLTLNQAFVEELLFTAQDVMPGNPGEIAGVYFKPAESTFTLPSFLIPPKIVLYNPDNLRGPDALPYMVVLVDKKFFGIPAAYLTPDRFDGCEELKHMKAEPRRPARPAAASGARPPQRRPAGKAPPPGGKPPAGGPPQKRRPSGPRPDGSRRGPPPGKPRPPGGPRRPDESGSRRGPPPSRPRPQRPR